MVGYVKVLLGLTMGGFAVATAMSLGVVNSAAVSAQAHVLIAAAFGMVKPPSQVMPAPVAIPATIFVPKPVPTPIPTSLAVPQAMPLAKPGLPMVVYPNGVARGHQATATRRRDGHFYFDTTVNGAPVEMLFDTGATVTSLRWEDAAKAGIDVGSLRYSVPIITANGKTNAAPVVIAVLTIGDITQRDVIAHVARLGAMSVTLLGQSFMSRIAGYKVDGDRLSLQASK